MATRSPRSFDHAFTLIELLVVIATITILVGIAVPALNSALERAKVTRDMNSLRQIGLGIQMYLNDKDEIFPAIDAAPGTGTTLNPVIYPKYIATRKIFQSPFDKRADSEADDAPVSYGINRNLYDLIGGNMARVVSPASTILMAPNYSGNPGASTSWTGVATSVPNLELGGGAGMTVGPQRNGTQINVLFCDLHAETIPFSPASTPGTFKDTTSDPLGLKHWNPTQ